MPDIRNRGGLLYLIKQLELGVRHQLDRLLREHALTVPQYTLLSVLHSAPGLSSAELARRSFVTAQSAHKLVRTLEHRGLIARVPHPGNRRVLRTYLTASGRALLKRCDVRARSIEEGLLARLPSAEASELRTTLQCCIRALHDPSPPFQSLIRDETDKEPLMTQTLDTTGVGAPKRLEHQAFKAFAAREVENVMNRYEYMMSHDQFGYVYDNLFATDAPDVRVELPFGRWEGPESVRRCIVGYHSYLCLDDQGRPRPGVLFYNANTQPIIEVADDLKTAKGLWICPGYSAKDQPDGTFTAGAGTAVRACDFLYDEEQGRWKIWHYIVTGLTSHPYDVSFVDNKVNVQSSAARVFPEGTEPDGEPQYSWMYSTEARVEYFPLLPEHYRTFAETHSY
ncbi:MarR family winged helix-turn-helix transcriptional regulator [Streptomyces sp. NPDC090088]|uniref:MarR family winged helix-turn-helix transcriptional regulator n=1 Tax=Streptomyces sp. NPDC090088 TaxID=3365944 RepID=UPI0038091136